MLFRFASFLIGVAAFAQAPRQAPLVPLLWTQGQPPETIRRVVREVADGGNTGFVWESRPHPDYLGPRWWSDLEVAIAEARRLGLEVWLFDEWMYPSGIAGGKVVAENPDFTVHVVLDRSVVVEGPQAVKTWEMAGPVEPSDKIVSVVAFPEPYRAKEAPVDLTGSSGAAAARRVEWAVPPGRWRLCWSVARPLRPRPGWRMDTMIDVLNPAAVASFIRLTHEATWRHFSSDFGKTIRGFFSDETGFRNVTSYDSLPGTPGMPMPWSPELPAYFRKIKGYEIAPLLASLWYDLGPRGRAARFDLMDVYSRGFAEIFFKPQQDWCRAHNVRLIGHLVEDDNADHQLGYGPGHWFRAMHFFDMPGIDVVGYQVTPGLDSGTNRWVLNSKTEWDQEFFQFGLPAMARGSALMKKTREIFAEAFGAYGWSEGLRMTKWIGDWLIVNGINVISPHAVTMKPHDPDCPPHYNGTSGNPQWRYYPVWSGPFRALQQITLESPPRYDVAVLYTAESSWMGPAQTVAPIVRALETRQLSTAVLPYEVWASEGSFQGGRWVYNGQRFAAVVLPYVRFVPAEAVRRLAEFARAGGRAIAVDDWPQASVDGRRDAEVARAVRLLKSSPAAMSVPLPELADALAPVGVVELQPPTTSVVVSRRETSDGAWLLLHNRSLSSAVRGKLLVRGMRGGAARLDPESKRYLAVPFREAGNGLDIEIEIPPYSLWSLRIAARLPQTEPAPRFRESRELEGGWQVTNLESGISLGLKTALLDWRRWSGLEAFGGTLRYTRNVSIPQPAPGERLALDAGRVEEIAELRVNGVSAGIRIHPPYRWDITAQLRPGDNEMAIDVTNTARARWSDEFSRGDPVSGLLGPVRLMRASRSDKE